MFPVKYANVIDVLLNTTLHIKHSCQGTKTNLGTQASTVIKLLTHFIFNKFQACSPPPPPLFPVNVVKIDQTPQALPDQNPVHNVKTLVPLIRFSVYLMNLIWTDAFTRAYDSGVLADPSCGHSFCVYDKRKNDFIYLKNICKVPLNFSLLNIFNVHCTCKPVHEESVFFLGQQPKYFLLFLNYSFNYDKLTTIKWFHDRYKQAKI